ncbi:MAG: hypothetical protein M3342_10465 [Bacteroidota bacterium]|nr:hypothetical protein [Bacteroidota bacterium]
MKSVGEIEVALGLANLRKMKKNTSLMVSRTVSYKAQNNLSYINIAAGTDTVFTSSANLILNNRIRDKRNAFNFYSYPNMNNKMMAGVAFTRSL